MKSRRISDNLKQAVSTIVESLESRQLMAVTLPVSINFQPASSTIPGGMKADTGAVYQVHGSYTYGWESNVSADAVHRTTSYTSYERYKAFINMQQGGDHKWEIALESGKYKVTLSGGDTNVFTSKLGITAEGTTALTGTTSSAKRYIISTTTLDVTDGKLTIANGADAVNNKIQWITIERIGDADGGNDHSGTSASISGITFNDNNKDGIFEPSEGLAAGKTIFLDLNGNNQLDAGEKSAVTDANGAYQFDNLTAGEYHVRRVFPAGYTMSSAPIDLTLAAGQIVKGANIGSKAGSSGGGTTDTHNAEISGFVFADDNKNGSLDADEAVSAGKTVFLDLNGNGKLDVGETSTVTDADGKYEFDNLDAGTYHVRRELPDGFTLTTTPINITLIAGQLLIDANIGSAKDPGDGSNGTIDYSKLKWTLHTPGPIPRVESEAAAVNGIVYVFSGYSNTNWQANPRVDKYNPATDTWTRLANMPVPVTHGATAVVGTKVWIAGGHAARPGTYNRQNIGITNVQIYDTVNNTWSTGPDLPAKLTSGGLALVNNKLYFFGGEDDHDQVMSNTWVLDLADQDKGWKSCSPIPEGRTHFGSTVVNGIIYAIAGQVGTDEASVMLKTAYSYDPVADEWTKLPDLPNKRSHITPNLHSFNGKIIMFGGESSHNHPIDEVLMYDPITKKYTELTPLPHPTGNGVAAYVNGKIIFYGGRTNTFSSDTYIGTFG